jgi:hypothetical protein
MKGMSIMKWSKSSQKCVTCEYWTGRRTPIQYGRYVETDNLQDRGACWHPDSASKTIDNKHPTDTCPKWEPWKVLV